MQIHVFKPKSKFTQSHFIAKKRWKVENASGLWGITVYYLISLLGAGSGEGAPLTAEAVGGESRRELLRGFRQSSRCNQAALQIKSVSETWEPIAATIIKDGKNKQKWCHQTHLMLSEPRILCSEPCIACSEPCIAWLGACFIRV